MMKMNKFMNRYHNNNNKLLNLIKKENLKYNNEYNEYIYDIT
jgi:hypothetical protein